MDFLGSAQLDAVGVFGYSDEDGHGGRRHAGASSTSREIRARVAEVAAFADEVMAQRAERRIGQVVEVLVEQVGATSAEGRAEHQGAEDGATTVQLPPGPRGRVQPGSILRSRVVSADGVDLQSVEVSVVRV